jgi:hypothetical protein
LQAFKNICFSKAHTQWSCCCCIVLTGCHSYCSCSPPSPLLMAPTAAPTAQGAMALPVPNAIPWAMHGQTNPRKHTTSLLRHGWRSSLHESRSSLVRSGRRCGQTSSMMSRRQFMSSKYTTMTSTLCIKRGKRESVRKIIKKHDKTKKAWNTCDDPSKGILYPIMDVQDLPVF